MKYRAKVELPEQFRTFVEVITSQAEFVDFDPMAERVTVEFEADDLWELAEAVHEINDALRGIDYYGPPVERPAEVEPQ